MRQGNRVLGRDLRGGNLLRVGQCAQVIARAKGWGLPEAVERLRANFVRFYDGFLAPAGELA